MNEPTLRKPTKKAFYFPTSAEARDEKSPAKAAKVAKAAKSPKAARTVKGSNAKENLVQTVKKAAVAAAEAATEAAPAAATDAATEAAVKGKARRAKKDDVKKDVKKESPKKESVKKESAKKEKVVRDSFTMPKADYEKIATLKKKCLDAGITVKKSELLRAGLMLLDSTSEKRLLAAVAAVETVKTGRPAKSV
ncbi:hypothetical protein [Paraburkholderia acidipaludis]|uniref:hypothetical protein n=1 Tax=Paraburkholderia acidipaludis TaxID=660537 RepID=UPI0004880730|nr:hypothetical protein [Paraburkholderia acidipaludis]